MTIDSENPDLDLSDEVLMGEEPELEEADPDLESEEPEAEEKAEEAPKAPPKPVPYGRFKEEREARKRAEQERQEVIARAAELNGRLTAFQQWQEAQQRAQYEQQQAEYERPQPAPDPQVDPAGYIVWQAEQNQRLEAQVRQTQEYLQQQAHAQQTHAQQTAYMEQLNGYNIESEKLFKAVAPDYEDAAAFLIQARTQELAALGYNQAQAAHVIRNEYLGAVDAMAKQRRNSAEFFYQAARARGYQPKQANAQPGARASMDRVAQGQRSAKSLSGVGGAPREGEISVETLLKMPKDDFAKWMAKYPKQAERLMGG